MNRRFGILVGVIVAVIAIWAGVWLWAAGVAASAVKTLETADGITTPRVTCGSFSITGFPFGFDATCSDATIVQADTTATVHGLKASVLVYNPFHVLAFAQSPVTIDNALTGSRSRLDFADAEASARLTGWRIGRVSLVVNAPVWNDTILEDRLKAKASKVEFHLVDDPQKYDAQKGIAALEEYVLVDGLTAPLQDIANGHLTFEGEINGLPDDVRTYGDADVLRRWQANGGAFRIVSLQGEDGDNRIASDGTLSLDASGRVQGQMKLISKGMVERFGAAIPDNFKGLVLGAQADDGSYSQTINIVGGGIFAGLIPTGQTIPPLW